MSDNEALITQFMDITGVNRERAEFYLESSNFQLQVALSSFYEDGPGEMPVDESPDQVEVTASSAHPAKKESKPSAGARNIKTLSSLNTSSSGDEGDEKGQAFYAGGSQTSGQQILGPPRKNPIKDYVSEVFKQAQSGNMETFEGSESSSSDTGIRSFSGTGYRLGETSDDHVAIPSSSNSRKKPDECDTVTVRVFRQGFTVDDGELRPYEDPRNREFFESITHNEIPAELRKQGRNMVHVNVEDHLSEDYVKRAPKFKAFQGSGHTLGSPTPATTQEASIPTPAASGNPAENEAKAAGELNVAQDQPTTMISIRLADGGRLSARFNLTHTVQDIRRFIGTARPEYSARNFTLLTTFPNKELANPGDTIAQAGLQNAAILQRLQ